METIIKLMEETNKNYKKNKKEINLLVSDLYLSKYVYDKIYSSYKDIKSEDLFYIEKYNDNLRIFEINIENKLIKLISLLFSLKENKNFYYERDYFNINYGFLKEELKTILDDLSTVFKNPNFILKMKNNKEILNLTNSLKVFNKIKEDLVNENSYVIIDLKKDIKKLFKEKEKEKDIIEINNVSCHIKNSISKILFIIEFYIKNIKILSEIDIIFSDDTISIFYRNSKILIALVSLKDFTSNVFCKESKVEKLLKNITDIF